MTFTSITFFAFVLLTLILYYAMPKKIRWVILLLASVVFYSLCSLKYIAFIVFTALSTYLCAGWIDSISRKTKLKVKAKKAEWSREEKKAFKDKATTKKRLIIALVLVVNFGILFVLKYYNFLSGSLATLLNSIGLNVSFPTLGLLLPLGISFYTFQTMGYIIDVYREKTPAETNFFKFFLFVSFFPQIVQGPISVYDDLAPQLYEGHKLEYKNIKYGFELIIWGLFKKMVIADRLVGPMNTILHDKSKFGGEFILLAVLIYSIQLYMDFSGGIDVARGVAQMLGINLTENFKRPYFSKTIGEYWRRWHISLGAWMKNYVFYPITMSKGFLKLGQKTKKSLGRNIGKALPGSIATFIVFMLIGIWHGANWKYVGFGLWNGLILFISNLFQAPIASLSAKLKIRTKSFSFRIIQMIRTFIIVLIGYYFDIADSFKDALVMIKRSVTDLHLGNWTEPKCFENIGFTAFDGYILAFSLLVVFVFSLYQEKKQIQVRDFLEDQSIWFQWAVLLIGLMSVIIFGVYGPGTSASEFVYMQF
ncbi:MAG: MBOAT family protein [Oscillospiraceae bacterium]|nr:MBOAT family protein [Candidatus Ruminococcus equi]